MQLVPGRHRSLHALPPLPIPMHSVMPASAYTQQCLPLPLPCPCLQATRGLRVASRMARFSEDYTLVIEQREDTSR